MLRGSRTSPRPSRVPGVRPRGRSSGNAIRQAADDWRTSGPSCGRCPPAPFRATPRSPVTVRRWSTIHRRRPHVLGALAPDRPPGRGAAAPARRRGALSRASSSRPMPRLRGRDDRDRLPPRDLVAGAQARRVRALPLPRGAVPDADVPPRLRRAAPGAANAPTSSTCASCTWRRARSRARSRRRSTALLEAGKPFDYARRQGAWSPRPRRASRTSRIPVPDLAAYDALIVGGAR